MQQINILEKPTNVCCGKNAQFDIAVAQDVALSTKYILNSFQV